MFQRRFAPTLLAYLLAPLALPVAFAGDLAPIDQLPPLVQATLGQKFPKATVARVERHDERNDYVYFVITLGQGKTSATVDITENGDIIPPPR